MSGQISTGRSHCTAARVSAFAGARRAHAAHAAQPTCTIAAAGMPLGVICGGSYIDFASGANTGSVNDSDSRITCADMYRQ